MPRPHQSDEASEAYGTRTLTRRKEAGTLSTLARHAAMSRSAFAARFHAVVGTPPMTYVAAARMRSARARLADGESVSTVANAFGYGSEAAFSRAFARITGQTPGRVRRAA